MKKAMFMLAIIAAMFTSCVQTTPSADLVDQKNQEQIQKQGAQKLGMPAIANYTEKRQLKDIYELCDQENLICYAYLFAPMTGKMIFLGKCRGFGIPYATQYSNPQKDMFWTQDYAMHLLMPQAEPNGLFKPSDAHGTWVLLLDPKGTPRPVYFEPDVIVSPFPLTTNQ